jgi:hypothetical protein
LRSWSGSGRNVSAPERRRLPDSSGIRSLAAEWTEELAVTVVSLPGRRAGLEGVEKVLGLDFDGGAGAVVCAGLGAVAQLPHAVADPALVQQLQLEPGPVGREVLAPTDHHGPDEQMVAVDQPGGDGRGAQEGTAHGEVTLGCRLQVPTAWG